MMNVFGRAGSSRALSSFAMLWVATLLGTAAHAQEPLSPFKEQLTHLDFALSGTAVFSSNSSGRTYLPQIVTQRPSNTAGLLFQVRYTKSPLIGAEINVGYARIDENLSTTNTTGSPPAANGFSFGAQVTALEYTLGYLAHGPRRFGVQPFAGVGGGAVEFSPTRNGGAGVLPQLRGAYYYTVGVENLFHGEHLGYRVSFRQLFYAAPDFQANFLAGGQRTITSEPTIGFFVRY